MVGRGFDLNGSVAVVTGASRGLGVSFAQGLTRAGADLLLVARQLELLDAVAADLRQYGRRVETLRVDIADPRDVEHMAAFAVEQFGRIDVLVNNAGISTMVPAEDMSLDDWRRVIDVNLTGSFLCAQAVGRQMLQQGRGKIINIASVYGQAANNFLPAASYVASKWGLIGLTKELASQWASRGLNVNAIAPGHYPTKKTEQLYADPAFASKVANRVPQGRLGVGADLEGVVVFLASAASDYVNGVVIPVDGGFLAW